MYNYIKRTKQGTTMNYKDLKEEYKAKQKELNAQLYKNKGLKIVNKK